MNKIQVLEVIAGFSIEYPLGGIERFVIELVQSFNKSKFEITVAGLWLFENTFRQKWIDLLNQKEVSTVEFAIWEPQTPLRSFLKTLVSVYDYVSSNPIDIYHSHDQFGDLIGILIKITHPKILLVRTVQNNFEWQRKPLRRILFTHTLIPLFYKREIGVNKSIVNMLNNRWIYKLINKKALNIPNASNLNKFMDINIDIEGKKTSLGIEKHHPIIGTVGRLHYQKGFDTLLNAIPFVLDDHPNALLVIVGDGPLLEPIKKQVEDLAIQKSVVLLGARGDIPEVLRIFDIFVSSSRWEGLPGVLLEAMASGIPIVATNIPGTNEIINNEINGLLVNPEDPVSMAKGIKQLLSSPEIQSKFIAESFIKVQSYSIENISHEYEKVYEGILNR